MLDEASFAYNQADNVSCDLQIMSNEHENDAIKRCNFKRELCREFRERGVHRR